MFSEGCEKHTGLNADVEEVLIQEEGGQVQRTGDKDPERQEGQRHGLMA